MSSTKKSENWLLVEWNSGGRDVVYVRSVVSPAKELKIGDLLTVNRRGEPEAAKLIARARERDPLDSMIKQESNAGPSGQQDDEPEDFSSSASSWAPSDDDAAAVSAESADEDAKVKLETSRQRQYSNRRSSKKILTPSHRANAVIPKTMQNAANRKRTLHDTVNIPPIKKSFPDSTRTNSAPKEMRPQKIMIDANEIMKINDTFTTLFKMLVDLKKPGCERSFNKSNVPTRIKAEASFDDDIKSENCPSDEFNRSDDNVLITNKFNNNAVKTEPPVKVEKPYEWVPIGSGKTLIHIDQFKKVNWKSYTIATRTLLLTVFPRRILATHSLTGKRSPAFQNKPAKMCLDPKIISDVIMEIMDRFNVRQNLVRGIITTKCADECKMWKAKLKKKYPKKAVEIIT